MQLTQVKNSHDLQKDKMVKDHLNELHAYKAKHKQIVKQALENQQW